MVSLRDLKTLVWEDYDMTICLLEFSFVLPFNKRLDNTSTGIHRNPSSKESVSLAKSESSEEEHIFSRGGKEI